MTHLFAHQKAFLKDNPNKTSLVWSCGTGKTRAAIEWTHTDWNYAGEVLIICPKSLKQNWRRECLRWSVAGLPSPTRIMSKEEFRKDWKTLPRFRQVIVDEVHNGFLTPLFKSQMSKALRSYLKKHNIPRVLLLSATVYTSSPWNIFNLAYYTGHNWNWRTFKDKFFYDVRMGPRMVPMVKKGSEKKLAELTKTIASVVSLEECADIPTQTFETEYFELTKEQNKLIKDSYDPLPIVRFTKYHEIAQGILKGNEFSNDIVDIPCLKNERIYSLCEENKKVVVVCRYNLQIDQLKKILTSLKKPIFVIRGDVKDRDSVVQEANKADEAVVLVQAACSAGYELQTFRVMVFASMDYSWVNYTQICGRILRLNNLQKNLYIHLLSGEMDEAIMDAIKQKENFDIELYAKRITGVSKRK